MFITRLANLDGTDDETVYRNAVYCYYIEMEESTSCETENQLKM